MRHVQLETGLLRHQFQKFHPELVSEQVSEFGECRTVIITTFECISRSEVLLAPLK